MKNAIEIAKKGVRKGNSPFGACIVKGKTVIAVAHNTVLKRKDATDHAEINAIHKACKKLRNHELRGCTIYSTTEPCPMCFSAIHWAKIDKIVFGTKIADVKKLGFSELTISAGKMKKLGRSKVKVRGDYMRKKNLELLKMWEKKKGKTY
ncbi:nucleoside deaminase [Patescibacteria group bacterium]|nr:nucleoside deaminase [Candidatus Micrarchaeota archaeon]MBU1758353.1 nucleoside deaminase [Patescibacteria group bacterium]